MEIKVAKNSYYVKNAGDEDVAGYAVSDNKPGFH